MPLARRSRITLSTASVSNGVSEAVGSSKITARCGTLRARAICTSWRWAIDSVETMAARIDVGAEPLQHLARPRVHGAVVDDEAARDLAADEDVLRDAQVRRQQDLLMDQDDAVVFGVDRAGEHDRLTIKRHHPAGRLQVAGKNLHQRRLAGPVLADQRMNLARHEIERDAEEDLDRPERHVDRPGCQDRLEGGTVGLNDRLPRPLFFLFLPGGPARWKH